MVDGGLEGSFVTPIDFTKTGKSACPFSVCLSPAITQRSRNICTLARHWAMLLALYLVALPSKALRVLRRRSTFQGETVRPSTVWVCRDVTTFASAIALEQSVPGHHHITCRMTSLGSIGLTRG